MIMTDEIILAIDYGTVRVGVAKSVLTLAQPLAILKSDERLLTNLAKMCQEYQITQIVVGLSENVMAEKTRDFVEDLKKVVDLPVEFWDETLSSHAVHAKVRELGWNTGKRRQPIDHLAAAEILQDWLDSQD